MGSAKIVLENGYGVKILELSDNDRHYKTENAICECGEELIVAPPICHPDHKKGDPVLVCLDHFIHGYRFSQLRPGRQPKGSAE